MNARYYSPKWRRFISPDSTNYLDPESINGLNQYCYCGNDPVKVRDNFGTVSLNVFWSILANSGSNRYNPQRHMESYEDSNPKSLKYNLLGAELRTSAGWSASRKILTGLLVRVELGHYITKTRGQSGILYAFAGTTTDTMNLLDTVYSAGVGVNWSGVIGAEVYGMTVGNGLAINFGEYSIALDVNITGATSITFGRNTDLGNGYTSTSGLTIGINTAALLVAAYAVLVFVSTGVWHPMPEWAYA